MRAGVVSLGCSKNLVDSEHILGGLKAAGFEICPDAAVAEVIIVNTCGFITPAKEESINTILEMAKYKTQGNCKLLAVTGCLSQRYRQELIAELPEVDLFWGVKDHGGLVKAICAKTGTTASCHTARRVLATPPYSAYLRIADGCDNRCTYCAIPLIRGGRVSVPMEQLIAEAEALAQGGVVELTVIAQDTSSYGLDLYGKPMLAPLLKGLAEIEKLHWVRVLYTYPSTVNRELIDVIADTPKLTNYIDMPIQHIDGDMLRAMNRHGTAEHIEEIMQYIRQRDESFILRSTVIVGFPGETPEQFSRLTDYLERNPIDRLGAFVYSQEENTPAADMPDQIGEEVKQERLDALMTRQKKISFLLNQRRIGKTYEVLVEHVDEKIALGRSYAEAPEVDGTIRFNYKNAAPRPGTFTNVKITGAGDYDLWGEEI